jgi:altronate dehydratase small subunit
MKNAVVIDDIDTVAVVIEPVEKGQSVSYLMPGGAEESIEATTDIQIYHKVAIRKMYKGDFVVKYGQHIGLAACDIALGEHVHEHNVESHRENLDKK